MDSLVLLALLCALAIASRRLWQRPFSLDNKVVVITGGASGIGRALAERLWATAQGVTLVLLDVDVAALEKAKTQLDSTATQGSSVLTYRCDVSKEEEVAQCIAQVREAVAPRKINVLVNNAGIVNGRDISDITPQQLERIFGINVFAHFHLVKHVLPSMKESESDCMIVSISSMFGLMAGGKLADYCATKAAVIAFHNCLRLELERDGFGSKIRTLLVCPLGVRTGMFDGIFEKDHGIFNLQEVLAPMLTQNEAVSSIHNAILDGKLQVLSCHPGFVGTLIEWTTPMVRLLPIPIQDYLARASGVVHGMDSFVGHAGKSVCVKSN